MPASIGRFAWLLSVVVLFSPWVRAAASDAQQGSRSRPLRVAVWAMGQDADELLAKALAKLEEARTERVELLRLTGDGGPSRPGDRERRRALGRLTEALRSEGATGGGRDVAAPPAGYFEELSERLSGTAPPDLLLVTREILVRLAREGRLLALDEVARSSGLGRRLPSTALDRHRYGGYSFGIDAFLDDPSSDVVMAVSRGAPAERTFGLLVYLALELRSPSTTSGVRPGSPGEGALTLTLRSGMTDAGRNRLGRSGVFARLARLLATRTSRVTIASGRSLVETFDQAGNPLYSVLLSSEGLAWSAGALIDHDRREIRSMAINGRRPSVESWMMSDSGDGRHGFYFANGCTLEAETRTDALQIRPEEARAFWSGVFWVEAPRGREQPFWKEVASWGLPAAVTLVEVASGEALVRLEVTAAGRGKRSALVIPESYQRIGHQQIEERLPVDRVDAEGGSEKTVLFSSMPQTAEHVGWLITSGMTERIRKTLNTVLYHAGSYKETDPTDGSLLIDWYAKASKYMDTSKRNELTTLRELLKTMIAMYVLPKELEAGQVPPELEVPYKSVLQSLFARKDVAAAQRWCAFIEGLKKPSSGPGKPAPSPAEHEAYRRQVLLDLVEKTFMSRYGSVKVDPIKPYEYTCWAFSFEAKDFKIELLPGSHLVKEIRPTSQGLRVDLEVERAKVDFNYLLVPEASAGNVTLCIFTAGVANLFETDAGDGELTARKVLLSFDLIPRVDGSRIAFDVKLANRSHVDLEYKLYGSNYLTFGKMEIISTIMSFANAFEDSLLKSIGSKCSALLSGLLVGFPDTFSFNDAPPARMTRGLIDSQDNKALLLGAELDLPKDRVPVPLGSAKPPECPGDFAITLASDYLNGVLARRLDLFRDRGDHPVFNWRDHVSAGDLPPVQLPQGYEPASKDSPFPAEYEEVDEAWEVTAPRIELAALTSLPGTSDAIGTVHLTVSYRLTKTRYGWRGTVRLLPTSPNLWWFDQFGPGPVSRDGVLRVDLERFLTYRYGLYRQVDGKAVSQPPSFLKLPPVKVNPSGAWHAMDVGGFVVEWGPYAVATDEHVNLKVEVSVPAHIEMSRLDLLPELDLSYGPSSAKTIRLNLSPAMKALAGREAWLATIVSGWLAPFLARHPMHKQFNYPYLNAYQLCGKIYPPYRPGEKVVLVTFDLFSMRAPNAANKLWIERDGDRLRVNFQFLAGFP